MLQGLGTFNWDPRRIRHAHAAVSATCVPTANMELVDYAIDKDIKPFRTRALAKKVLSSMLHKKIAPHGGG